MDGWMIQAQRNWSERFKIISVYICNDGLLFPRGISSRSPALVSAVASVDQ